MHLFEFTVTIYLFNSNYRRKSGPSEVTGGNLKSSFINIENQIQYNSLGIRYPYTLTMEGVRTRWAVGGKKMNIESGLA